MNALMEKPLLPAFLHGDTPELVEDRFVIDDERKAAWAAGKILLARRRIQGRANLADSYQQRILDWLMAANEPDRQSAEYLEGALRPWVEESVALLGKARSLRLPGSKVGLRKKPDKVEVMDAEAALAFCQEFLEDAVVVKRELSKTELKKHLLEGARVPGAELVTGSDELTVVED